MPELYLDRWQWLKPRWSEARETLEAQSTWCAKAGLRLDELLIESTLAVMEAFWSAKAPLAHLERVSSLANDLACARFSMLAAYVHAAASVFAQKDEQAWDYFLRAETLAEEGGDLFRLYLIHATRHQLEQGNVRASSGHTDQGAARALAEYFAAPPLMSMARFGAAFLSGDVSLVSKMEQGRRRAVLAEMAAENDIVVRRLWAPT